MSHVTRRNCIQGTLAALAAAGLPPASATPRPQNAGGIKLALAWGSRQAARFPLAKQIGVNYAIASTNLSRYRREQYVEVLTKLKSDYAAVGLKVAGVESHPVSAEKIKLGLPGRDEEIENYKTAIDALSKVGIPVLCYNFMAGLGWVRTNVKLPERGGALSSEFDYADAEKQGLTEWGEVSEEKMWQNIEYFLKAVIPVADKVGTKMALHPDDPPISPLRGIARIVTSARNYERIMEIVPSPVNGMTFCQANFKAMGEDIAALAQKWCVQKKIFFVHFRDIDGDKRHFRETFHDNGPTDMVRMLKIYSEAGFDGPMRPDHAPTLAGESNDNPGYAVEGRILAIGYMKGIMDALRLPYE